MSGDKLNISPVLELPNTITSSDSFPAGSGIGDVPHHLWDQQRPQIGLKEYLLKILSQPQSRS
jgi:hypothetical protein